MFLEKNFWLKIESFSNFIHSDATLDLTDTAWKRIDETRLFIDYLLEHKIKAYGLTTGFADLRNTSILPEQSAFLSRNLIASHDAGIGKPLPLDVTLGAMVVRAHSLAQGYSGFSKESLKTLIGMINHRIIPLVPCTGSLGASGDLAFLARLGRAMMGEDAPVMLAGVQMSARDALKKAKITPFSPLAKEGLALTNGTAFMASSLAISFDREVKALNALMQLTGLFLNAVGAIDAAFYGTLQNVRRQEGQTKLAAILSLYLEGSDLIDRRGVQNDYCIRCLPQIYGPRIEMILQQSQKIENELNAVTDNPLIFRNEEITDDVEFSRIISIKNMEWAILSGGNFHGENITAVADLIAACNAKIALTMERQITYLMNPFRNQNILPPYLIEDVKMAGLYSGFMILQYTANALAHKICLAAHPAGAFNTTSANEAEDVVSYGATACQKLYEQIDLFEELISLYLIAVAQAYSLRRGSVLCKNRRVEKVFETIQSYVSFPRGQDESFQEHFARGLTMVRQNILTRDFEGISTFFKEQSYVPV